LDQAAAVNAVVALSPLAPFGAFEQSGFGQHTSLDSFDNCAALEIPLIEY
jgi:hypothetical protein